MAQFDQQENVGGQFPATRYSAILALSSSDASERDRALDLLVRAYWSPLYKYARLRWRMTPDDASDLVQGFFALALEREFLQSYDQQKAKFRTFLRLCLDRHAANEHRSRGTQKRGGAAEFISIEQSSAESELQSIGLSVPPDIDSWFEREWARQVFSVAIERLEKSCDTESKQLHFLLFQQYDLTDRDESNKMTYDILAAAHNIPVTDVTNHLAFVRRKFRSILLEVIRELTGSDEEYRAEVRALLGLKI